MNHDSILKIVDGHPLLAGDSYLPLDQAAGVYKTRGDSIYAQNTSLTCMDAGFLGFIRCV